MTHNCAVPQGGPERASVHKIANATVVKDGLLQVPCSSIQQLDKARVKQKEVYEGSFQASKGVVYMLTGLLLSDV